MRFSEVRPFFERLSFKRPDRNLDWSHCPEEHAIRLRYSIDTLDATGARPGKITIVSVEIVPLERVQERDLLHIVRRLIERTEAHEAMEWLKFDGVLPFDPHAGEKPRDLSA